MQVYGLHTVLAMLQSHPKTARHIYVQSGGQSKRLQEVVVLSNKLNLPLTFVNRQTLDQMSGKGVHQGVVLICSEDRPYSENDLPSIINTQNISPLILLLDGVQDPHNLGACLRTANAANVQAVIVPKDKAVGLTPVVRKVASGAVETTPFIQVTNMARCLQQLKKLGIWIYGASDDADQLIYEADLCRPLAWVLGAEGKGLRPLTRKHCDCLLRIPMRGAVSSLNVSVASGVVLFETLRARGLE